MHATQVSKAEFISRISCAQTTCGPPIISEEEV
jgi:hypothetical protein